MRWLALPLLALAAPLAALEPAAETAPGLPPAAIRAA